MKTVIEMAREAGFLQEHILHSKALEQFANLIRADERDACAMVYEAEADTWEAWPQAGAAKRKGAASIRSRGNT